MKKIFAAIVVLLSVIFLTGICYADDIEILKEDSSAKGMVINNVYCIKHGKPSHILFTQWKTERMIKESDINSEKRIDAFIIHNDNKKTCEDCHYLYKHIDKDIYYSEIYPIMYNNINSDSTAKMLFDIIK